MAVPAEVIGGAVLHRHRERLRQERARRRLGVHRKKGETTPAHAQRLRRLQAAHETAARHTSLSAERQMHEQAARDIEKPAGDAEYKASTEAVSSEKASGSQGWESALFLMAGSAITLWLLLSGHLKAAGEAIGWLPTPKAKRKAGKKIQGVRQ